MPMAGWIFERPGHGKLIVTAFVNNVLDDVAVLQVLRHGRQNFRQTAEYLTTFGRLGTHLLMGAF